MFWTVAAAAAIILLAVSRSWRRRLRGRARSISAHEIGAAAEARVVEALTARGIHVIHDLYLPLGRTAVQIDALALVGDTIQVIEVKGHHGRIQIAPQAEHWTVTYPGGQRHPIYSPLRQNELHLRALRKAFGLAIPFRSAVIFTDAVLDGAAAGVHHGISTDWTRGWAEKPTYAVWRKLMERKQDTVEQDRLRRIHAIGIERRKAA